MAKISCWLTAALLLAPVVLPAAASEDDAPGFVIDFANEEQAREQAESLRGRLSGPGSMVELNLTVLPAGSGPSADYRSAFTRANSDAGIDIKCDDGWRRFEEPGTVVINFNGVDNHFFLSIRHDDAASAPYSTIACEYAGSDPERPAFVIRGFYAKSILNIPTAVDVELRPVAP